MKEGNMRGDHCIERVKQRGAMPMGQHGKMSMAPKEQAHWKREGDKLTPRRA
jgi:hypothetical protein